MRSNEPKVKGTPSNYEGTYVLARQPRSLAPHNQASWKVIAAILEARGSADYYDLAVAVRGHEHGTKSTSGPQSFVSYCIKSGWLQQAGQSAFSEVRSGI